MGDRCIRPSPEELENFGTPDFTIYNAGQFPCNRYTHYMTSSTSIDLNLARREMVILGTMYAGEMKKGLFSVMHYLMPKRQILSLHSGCNMGKDGDVAIFFGLSGIVLMIVVMCGSSSYRMICALLLYLSVLGMIYMFVIKHKMEYSITPNEFYFLIRYWEDNSVY